MFVVLLALSWRGGSALAQEPAQETVSVEDRALHERIVVLDSHLDTPAHFGRAGWDITKPHTYANDLSQVDLPRMVAGGLDGGFFVVFTPQGPLTAEGYAAARNHALLRLTRIRETVAAHADKLELATTASDALRIAKAGKRVVFQSVENSFPIGEDLTMVSTFRALGVRLAGPVHGKNNQLADSATDRPRWRGLSPLGKRWVAAMNRAGLVIDGSHASDAALDQMIALSKTPLLLSHSGPKFAFDHPRNLDDARLRKLAAAGGVMQVNSLWLVPINDSPALGAVIDKLDVIDTLSVDEQARLVDAHRALDPKEVDSPGATLDMFMGNLLHAISVAGVDHVGIGADWDGGGGVSGLADVVDLPKVTARLRKAGYSDVDIEKIWSGNLLRVLDAAERARSAP